MPKKKEGLRSPGARRSSADDDLQAVNARLTTQRNPAAAIRRTIEADIERKAQRKRSRETPASAGFKRQT